MTRRAVAGLALAAAACASSGPPAPPPPAAPPTKAASAETTPSVAPPSHEARLIARALKQVTALRQVDATRPVPGKTLPRDQLIARVKEHVAREIPTEEIEREGLILRLLGFVPDQFDYAKEMFALLEAQLAGFYEPEDATMYMAGDLDGMNAEATLAHELVHALQDQHWDLKRRGKYQPGQSDRQGALAALAEGDATSAMADYIVGKSDPSKTALDVPEDLFTEQVLSSVGSGAGGNTPHVMRASLVAPYVDGLLFVNALRRRGGWALVNRAWDEPPTTTEQILHVEKWEAREPAIEVAEPTAATLGADWVNVDRDTYGEQGLRLLLQEWMPTAEAKTAASAWGGDRGSLFAWGARPGQKLALALRVRFDEARGPDKDAFAARSFKMVQAALAKIGHPKSHPNKGSAEVCVERAALGPLAARLVGRDVILVAGPASFEGKKSAAAGDCALATKWIAEIAEAPR